MESPNPTSRPNLTNIIAACIVAAGLVSAARIVSQRPVLSTMSVQAAQSTTSPASMPIGRPLPSPPLSQETIWEQVRTQVLAAPALQAFRYKNVDYKLSDVTVSEISYVPKEDVFSASLHWVWQPAMPSGGPQEVSLVLSNNGYNQYSGSAVLSPIYGGSGQNADICVK